MKAVGAVAAGRNRKVHMRIASVTIYCDEGSKGSNPALPQKKLPLRQLDTKGHIVNLKKRRYDITINRRFQESG